LGLLFTLVLADDDLWENKCGFDDEWWRKGSLYMHESAGWYFLEDGWMIGWMVGGKTVSIGRNR